MVAGYYAVTPRTANQQSSSRAITTKTNSFFTRVEKVIVKLTSSTDTSSDSIKVLKKIVEKPAGAIAS